RHTYPLRASRIPLSQINTIYECKSNQEHATTCSRYAWQVLAERQMATESSEFEMVQGQCPGNEKRLQCLPVTGRKMFGLHTLRDFFRRSLEFLYGIDRVR